jgi:hypothetical protein
MISKLSPSPEHLSSPPFFSGIRIAHCQLKSDKNINNDLHNTTQKTKDWAIRIPLKNGGELRCSGEGDAARDLVLHGIVSQSNRPRIINGKLR